MIMGCAPGDIRPPVERFATEIKEFDQMFEKCGGALRFREFLSVYSLKNNPELNEVDAKNSFRLLSKEYDRPNMIKLERCKEVLTEMGVTPPEIAQMATFLE